MGNETIIKKDSICDCISEFARLTSQLNQNNRRQFLTEGDTNGIHHVQCYIEMLHLLNTIEDCELGFLLRNVWRTYENDLRVNSLTLAESEDAYYGQDDNGKWGIFINLGRNNRGSNWHASYHIIFHEFFHNIYDVADLKDKNMIERFGNTIIYEVNELFKEENNKNANKKRLNDLTFKEPKINKAALYDIIGAVLYKGKYGCNPSNSKLYTHDKKDCEDKFMCTRTQTEACNYREESRNFVVNICTSVECAFKKLINYDYRIPCHLRINNWCNNIFGHLESYWRERDKEEKDKLGFSKVLAEEAFVHMAAEAIVNPVAYKNIKECLPISEEMFRDILEEMTNWTAYGQCKI
ncbi:MAG: hypothetical protein FWC26_06025 [Fibromonadales bacterium]|nr:hypothetical protein [Fibromonadales bacterium]